MNNDNLSTISTLNMGFHQGRREALMKQFEEGTVVVVIGGCEQVRNHDNYFPFRQESSFFI